MGPLELRDGPKGCDVGKNKKNPNHIHIVGWKLQSHSKKLRMCETAVLFYNMMEHFINP